MPSLRSYLKKKKIRLFLCLEDPSKTPWKDCLEIWPRDKDRSRKRLLWPSPIIPFMEYLGCPGRSYTSQSPLTLTAVPCPARRSSEPAQRCCLPRRPCWCGASGRQPATPMWTSLTSPEAGVTGLPLMPCSTLTGASQSLSLRPLSPGPRAGLLPAPPHSLYALGLGREGRVGHRVPRSESALLWACPSSPL